MAEVDTGRDIGRAGRAPWLRPGDLDDEQREVYEGITGGPRASSTGVFSQTDADGRLLGPFNAMLFSPAVGNVVQNLGAVIRYGMSLPDRTREIAILEVSRARNSEFEWYAHSRLGAKAGLTDPELEAIRTGAPLPLEPIDAIVREVSQAMLTDDDLDDELFGRAEAQLGARGLSEVLTLVGYYSMLASSLRVWRTPLPEGVEPVL